MINLEQFEAEVAALVESGQKMQITLNPAEGLLLAVILRNSQDAFRFTPEGTLFVARLLSAIKNQFPKGCNNTHRVIEQGGLSDPPTEPNIEA